MFQDGSVRSMFQDGYVVFLCSRNRLWSVFQEGLRSVFQDGSVVRISGWVCGLSGFQDGSVVRVSGGSEVCGL